MQKCEQLVEIGLIRSGVEKVITFESPVRLSDNEIFRILAATAPTVILPTLNGSVSIKCADVFYISILENND